MGVISGSILYISIFLSVYVQVFFLVTFFENSKKIITRSERIKLKKYPSVTIIVPCFNEEKTVYKTVRSLLDLNYPKEKLKIFLIDDGSTDSTWNAISKFLHYTNIKLFKKENGGKYTALNLGLQNIETEFVGCLDADSFAHSESLIRIMSYFEHDDTIMAVAPSVTVYNPQNIIQNAQKAEYHMGVFMKKMLGFLGAINVTPGPLTIFRKKVFDDLGPYRHAHNTEDMEIAYRMQKNHYKIEHCNDAYVYTNTPGTMKKLYKQRLRWIYGFINNTFDYRGVLFRKKYGNFALFTLPTGIISI
ncbi:MAG: glycosyltransferase family 2 protein, partial [Patescibacteria group bacterium]